MEVKIQRKKKENKENKKKIGKSLQMVIVWNFMMRRKINKKKIRGN